MTAPAAQSFDLVTRALRARDWERRLEEDAARARDLLDAELAEVTATVVARARALGAQGLALTGSTARARRTAISDLDFLVVGRRPSVDDLVAEIDLRPLTPEELVRRARHGDEYVQWALRFGCILHDTGVLREGAKLIATTGVWPDPDRKRRHAATLVELAVRIVASGDRDAADEAGRAALTALGHWILLANRIFPLSRNEIPDQLLELGSFDLAAALSRAIHNQPALDELAAGLRLAQKALDLSPEEARKVTLGTTARTGPPPV